MKTAQEKARVYQYIRSVLLKIAADAAADAAAAADATYAAYAAAAVAAVAADAAAAVAADAAAAVAADAADAAHWNKIFKNKYNSFLHIVDKNEPSKKDIKEDIKQLKELFESLN